MASLKIGDRVEGLKGRGTVTELAVAFGKPAAWVRFDGADGSDLCPAAGLEVVRWPKARMMLELAAVWLEAGHDPAGVAETIREYLQEVKP